MGKMKGGSVMPYIRLSITRKLEEDIEQKLVDGIGEALSKIPGKDPCWTMVEVSDGLKMYFGGIKQTDMVFADIKYVGKFEYHKKKEFTAAAFDAIHEILGTSKDRICLTITEFTNWGAVGDFRDVYYSE
jgi:phenylpyruvate tautomerase PptA (4-oxalocrotonate tautomerase family)